MALKIDVTFRNFNVFAVVAFSFFKLNTDFFEKILYWIVAKDTNVQLVCKFEANRCSIHGAMAEN